MVLDPVNYNSVELDILSFQFSLIEKDCRYLSLKAGMFFYLFFEFFIYHFCCTTKRIVLKTNGF